MKKLKIVIAPDSFKGSLGAKEVADAIEKGLLKAANGKVELETVKNPIADGGEGTLATMVEEKDISFVEVTGPQGAPVTAALGFTEDVAVIEMAQAAGLTLVEPLLRVAKTATTFGVGEMIKYALDKGLRRFLVTVGGSATNDGGAGMLAALGGVFCNKSGKSFVPMGATLCEIETIELSGLDSRLKGCDFTIATDVKNTLYGDKGATYVYGAQKGANEKDLADMEAGMKHYASLVETLGGKKVSDIEGCGAGGGVATPLLAFCRAQIVSGIEAVLDITNFYEHMKGADFVLTGEGKIDVQSLYGKAISGVAKGAAREKIPVVCFVGCIGSDKDELKALGVSDVFATADIAPSAEYSMAHADILLEELAKNWLSSFLS
ncbi:MAG: glycerate kinase [Ruminococcaceae bacterium]|nr:glycerate kinase [Oscillospiraceae bacterium]